MGKKGIPMTVVMNNPSFTGTLATDNADQNTVIGSFYVDGDGTYTNIATGSKYNPNENA